jgi:hypothetical protein
MDQALLEKINMPEVDTVSPGEGASLPLSFSPLFSPANVIVADQYPPRSAPNKASKGESGFVDGSGPIFSMYLGMAEEEDKELAESWKADAEGILVFVRLYVLIPCFKPVSSVIDWFILRCCRLFDFGVDSGPPTESTGYV